MKYRDTLQNNNQLFLERFKTEVQQCSSKDSRDNKIRSQKFPRGMTPKHKHSIQTKSPIRCQPRTIVCDSTDVFSHRPSPPNGILLGNLPRDNLTQKGSRVVSGPTAIDNKDVSLMEAYNNILMKIFEDLQYRKQFSMSKEDEIEDRKRSLATIEQCVIVAGILLENTNKLKMSQDFEKDAYQIDYFVRKLILRISEVYKSHNVPITTPSRFDKLNSRSQQPFFRQNRTQLDTQQKKHRTDSQKEESSKLTVSKKNNVESSGRGTSSFTSFQIQNEDKHSDYYLLYQEWYHYPHHYKESDYRNSQRGYQQLYELRKSKQNEGGAMVHQGKTVGVRNRLPQNEIHDQPEYSEPVSEDSEANRSILNQVIAELNKKFKKHPKVVD